MLNDHGTDTTEKIETDNPGKIETEGGRGTMKTGTGKGKGMRMDVGKGEGTVVEISGGRGRSIHRLMQMMTTGKWVMLPLVVGAEIQRWVIYESD